jgi:hypothetical protein
MDEDHDKVADMRDQIREGEYRVEPKAVADAILRRLRELAAARREHVAAHERARAQEDGLQMRCSYPESSPAASVNTTPGDPSITRPTGVSPTVLDTVASALSTALRPDAGRQTQIS